MCITGSESSKTRSESAGFLSSSVASNGGAKRSAGPRLGNKRQSFHPDHDQQAHKISKSAKELRREAASDQHHAAKIIRTKVEENCGCHKGVPGQGIRFCGWTQIADNETKLMRIMKEHGFHAYITGRQMCGLRWVCPICTAKRAEEDRKAVNDGLAAARSRGGVWPVMLTLTTRHTRKDDATPLLAAILLAEQQLKRLKCWTRVKERMPGYARVLEWTYGDKNGHHPHFHTILLIRAETEADAIALVEGLRSSYMDQLQKAGRDGTSKAAWHRSFQVQGASAAENYITKWGAAEELTGAQKKDDGKGLNPWQLLRLSRTAETEAERKMYMSIWLEIIAATKGKAQLFKSAGWNQLVELWRSQQPEEEPAAEPEEVADFGVRTGREATQRWSAARTKTLVLREAAECHEDLGVARDAVEDLLISGQLDNEIFAEMSDEEISLIDDDDVPLISLDDLLSSHTEKKSELSITVNMPPTVLHSGVVDGVRSPRSAGCEYALVRPPNNGVSRDVSISAESGS